MKIEISIAEAEFLKKLVFQSDEWNNGHRMGDVAHKLAAGLEDEKQRIMNTPTLAEAKEFFAISDLDWNTMDVARQQSYVNEIMERFPKSWRHKMPGK